jgi:hypothetical protein
MRTYPALAVTCQNLVDQGREQFGLLNPADQKQVHKWMPVSHRRIGRGRYKNAKAWLAAATKDLKPKAVDWPAVLAFLQGLMPLIAQLIAMFTKVPVVTRRRRAA